MALPQFMHSSLDECLGCFYFWAFMNNAAIHTCFLIIICNIVNKAEFTIIFIYLIDLDLIKNSSCVVLDSVLSASYAYFV